MSHTVLWRLLDPSQAFPETGPWEDGAYFITKSSALSAKNYSEADLNCAVIWNRIWQMSSKHSSFHFSIRFSFFFYNRLTVTLLSTWGLVEFPQLDEGRAGSRVSWSFSNIMVNVGE